ncbi:MAG: M48 family metalloprotease [Oceanicoccus sp.]|uniref:M48 family metalloprotease n=1 Tax=Oceanicoccus sp. TaxID=2691044 RepID=UPI0026278E7D|nr:M48 family metalloprotease [Oceanicoccus sp.]MDG1771847.1 M48 family metalloprotease [Oceanicoccus sp.]
MKNLLLTLWTLLAALLINPATAQVKQEIELPELGDASSALFSLDKEYQLGRAWLRVFRSRVEIVSDPLLQGYVEELTYKLATHSELKDRRLDIIIVNNQAINAFAVPGGVLGIHNGLLLQAETEAQFASVMSHELAHLSQRHFARSVEAQKRNAIPNMAGLLAGIILAATEGGNAGMVAIAATQAASLQNQLRYSRLHEQEADRTGMETMVRADMDPSAAAGMFEVMQQASRYYGNRPPEFLLTHPVTESRISDARNRSRQYPRKMYTDNPNFQLMRARVEISFIDSSKDAVKHFRAKLEKPSRYPDADQYGLILALTANSEFEEAQQRLNTLMAAEPNEISYMLALAELQMASGQLLEAINLLEGALSFTPNSHPISMMLARTYLLANQPHRAEALLEQHTTVKPNDPSVWYLLAETHGLAGNIIGVHRARAEYFVLNGVLDRAAKQLSYALPLVKNDHLTSAKIKQRIVQIKQLEVQMSNL